MDRNRQFQSDQGDGKRSHNVLKEKNKELNISPNNPEWKHVLGALKELKKINSDKQPDGEKIIIREGKIEFSVGGKGTTLDKNKKPAEFMQFEYNLRKRLVEEALKDVLHIGDQGEQKKITGVEKIKGVYIIKCDNNRTEEEYRIQKQDDGRYLLLNKENVAQSQDDMRGHVNDWEKTMKDLKLKVRDIHMSKYLEESVKTLLSKDEKGKIKDKIEDIKKESVTKEQIESGQIVDYDRDKKWTIRTKDGQMHQFQLDKETEIEEHARLSIINEEYGKSEKGGVVKAESTDKKGQQYKVKYEKSGEDVIILDKETMKKIESDASISETAFTEKEFGSVIDKEPKNEKLESAKRKFALQKRLRKGTIGLLEVAGWVDSVAGQEAQNFEMAFGQFMQLGGGENQQMQVTQIMNQHIVDHVRRDHERRTRTSEAHLAKLEKNGKVN